MALRCTGELDGLLVAGRFKEKLDELATKAQKKGMKVNNMVFSPSKLQKGPASHSYGNDGGLNALASPGRRRNLRGEEDQPH